MDNGKVSFSPLARLFGDPAGQRRRRRTALEGSSRGGESDPGPERSRASTSTVSITRRASRISWRVRLRALWSARTTPRGPRPGWRPGRRGTRWSAWSLRCASVSFRASTVRSAKRAPPVTGSVPADTPSRHLPFGPSRTDPVPLGSTLSATTCHIRAVTAGSYRSDVGQCHQERCESGRIGLTANRWFGLLRHTCNDTQLAHQARSDWLRHARTEIYRPVIGQGRPFRREVARQSFRPAAASKREASGVRPPVN